MVSSLLLTAAAMAQTPHDSIDRYIHSEMAKRHIPGLSLLVVRDGKTSQIQGYGLANVEL